MSMTIQIICAVSLAIIATYYIFLFLLALISYLKIRDTLRYFKRMSKEKLEPALDKLNDATQAVKDTVENTQHKVDDFTDIITQAKEKVEELLNLLDYINEKVSSPALNIIAALRVLSSRVSKWM